MKHRKESLGYRIESKGKVVAITGDTVWTPDLVELAKDVDVLITECEFYNKNQYNVHFSYEELKLYRDKLKAQKIILTHYGSEFIQNKEKFLKEKEDCYQLAEDGMIINLE